MLLQNHKYWLKIKKKFVQNIQYIISSAEIFF